jgi:hypothetical protein
LAFLSITLNLVFIASRVPNPSTLCTVFGPSTPLILGAPESTGIFGLPSERLLEIEFRARRNYLETFLPETNSRIASPGGWSKASLVVRHIRPGEWKGHCEVTILGLCIFDALVSPDQNKPKEFNPVIFCDKAEFVIAAREELNLPILLTDMKESVIGAQYQMKLQQSGISFMDISANLVFDHLNGVSDKKVCGKSRISMTLLKSEVVEAVFPGLANVIGRLQGLDIKDAVVARSSITL